jgi:hypothetical protein
LPLTFFQIARDIDAEVKNMQSLCPLFQLEASNKIILSKQNGTQAALATT